MPFEIILKEIPAGHALLPGRSGEKVPIALQEFLSSEDGIGFIRRLEGFPNIILSRLPAKHRPPQSVIDHLLAIIRKDKTAVVYVNELNVQAEVLSKRDLTAGQPVYGDDIADIRAIKFSGIDVPPDVGVLYIFSCGWRKAIFYDFAPIQPSSSRPRAYDLSVLLGQFHAYLMFQERLKISEKAWNALFTQGWFPFISLPTNLAQELANHAEYGWNIDDLLNKISNELGTYFEKWKMKWSKSQFFKDHHEIFNTAIERYLASDYISAVSILYPRIEGIMRTYHICTRPSVSQTQKSLVDTVISSADPTTHPKMLLLPDKFHRYLTEVYFAAFDPSKPEGTSRHTIAHGVAPQDAFSEKASVIGFLILDQLSYYFAT